jgi:hypothetical protein
VQAKKSRNKVLRTARVAKIRAVWPRRPVEENKSLGEMYRFIVLACLKQSSVTRD